MSSPIIVYGHSMCPVVPMVKALLEHSAIEYTYIDIHTDEAARLRVKEINGGYESVPTLVFSDKSTLTEPSMRVLRSKLIAIGYEVTTPDWFKFFQTLFKKVSNQSCPLVHRIDKENNMQKIAVVVFADLNDSHADLARVTNALQIVQEFKEAGDDVRLLFDGGSIDNRGT